MTNKPTLRDLIIDLIWEHDKIPNRGLLADQILKLIEERIPKEKESQCTDPECGICLNDYEIGWNDCRAEMKKEMK